MDTIHLPRFYYSEALQIERTLTLTESIAHHIQVLRLAQGSDITLFNGTGGEYIARLISVEKKQVIVRIHSFLPREVESRFSITLAQALPESGKMDWIIEKAIELGVAAIQPLMTQRCVTRLSPERAAKKQAHWERIIVAASEQSGRNQLLQLHPCLPFQKWIVQPQLSCPIMLSPHADTSLAHWIQSHPVQTVTVIIGPEGGLTEQEKTLAQSCAIPMLSMGPRILRTETAGLAAVAMINGIWELALANT